MHAWSGGFRVDLRTRRILAALTVPALAAGLLFAQPLPPAAADDGAVGGDGGDVYPLANNDIRMQAETVQAICFRGFAEYRVDFEFVNRGKAQTVKLGFLFAVTKSDNMGTAPADFRAWQDGRPLTVTIGREVSSQNLSAATGVGYYLHEATFPPGKTMITVTYFAAPSHSAAQRYPELAPKEFADAGITGWDASYWYWLHTGAGWRDTIGRAVVRYTLADSFAGWAVDVPPDPGQANSDKTGPTPYTRLDDRTYQWVFEDFEPTENDDITLAFSNPVPPFSDPSTQPDNDLPAGMGAWTEVGAVSGDARPLSTDGTPEWSPGLFGGAWGAPAPGVGGWIRLSLKGNRDIKEFRILPGRLDSLTSFKEYARPKTVRVTLSDGASSDFTLADDPSLQLFPIRGTATEATIKILDVYPGTKSRDTYISYIEFGNETAPAFGPFAKLITEQAPPPTTTTSSTELSITTTQPTAPPQPSTSVAATSPTPAGGSNVANPGKAGRLLWPAWLGLGVGIVGLAALAFFVMKLRRSARSQS